MKLTPVIAALRARCPYFENRVAGAAQFKNLPEVGKLRLPAAYVVPGDDSPGENKSQTDYTPYPVVDLAQSNNASGATGPNPFMINKASAPKVDGEIKVSFVNSPPGMRVMETRSSGFDVSHDVGYTRFGR